jgi:hypothetical protein
VPAVEVAVVGRGREQHVRQLRLRCAGAYGGDDGALGSLRVPHVDETPEPPCEPVRIGGRSGERLEQKVRRVTGRVRRDIGHAVVEGGRTIIGVDRRDEVHEARERRQPAEPAGASPLDPEVERRAEDVDARRVGLDERDRRLRGDEREITLEAVTQPLPLVRDWIHRRPKVDEDVVIVHFDRKPAEVVRPLVEGAARTEIEARVMPVARQDPVRDRAAMEWEAHVRAAIVDGVDLVTVGEQTEGLPADVHDESARSAQLAERCGTGEVFGDNRSHRFLLRLGTRDRHPG